MAVADHACATAVEADNTFWPSELTNDFVALCLVEQGRQLDQVHHGFRSLPHRERPTDQRPDQDQHAEILPRAGGSLSSQGLFITPQPDKSLPSYSCPARAPQVRPASLAPQRPDGQPRFTSCGCCPQAAALSCWSRTRLSWCGVTGLCAMPRSCPVAVGRKR